MNLLFIYTDEQAYNTLACYGNDWISMPNLNALASQCTVFDKAYVSQPVCTPSRSTLLTGLWPHTNGCTRNNLPLQAETECLPEMVTPGRYATGHYGKWHLGDEIFQQHGFDEWVNYEDMYSEYYAETRDPASRSQYHSYLLEQGFKPNMEDENKFGRAYCCRLPEEHGKPAWIALRAVDFIKRNSSRPFALYVNFLEPHMPFFGPRDEQYDPESIPLPANHDAMPDETMPAKYIEKSTRSKPESYPGKSGRTEDSWRKLRARYYGLCSLVDTHAGAILDALREQGLWDETLIVFTSDHGDMMGSHQQTAKGVMYEEAVRVPLLIKHPGQTSPQHFPGPVSQIDVLPTILDFMGERIPEQLQGTSLRHLMDSDTPTRQQDAFLEWNSSSSTGGEPNNPGESVVERAIVTPDGWKFVWSSCGKHILFDQNKDPGETRNLYGLPEYTSLVTDLVARIRAWQERTGDKLELTM